MDKILYFYAILNKIWGEFAFMEKKNIRLHSTLTPAFTLVEAIDADYIRHSHSLYELIYLLDGTLYLLIEESHYTMKAGDLALIPGNSVHGFHTETHSHSFIGAFHLGEIPEFQKLFEGRYLLSPYIPACPETAVLPKLFRKIIESSDSQGSLLIPVGYLHLLLGEIVPLLTFATNQANGENASLASQAITYIGDNVEKNLTLESVAEHLGISKYYLSRIFNQQLNVSFNTFLSFLRVNAGKRLLVQTELQIGEIAFMCGFDSVRSFNRTFKEFSNQTPTAYRNSNKGKAAMNYNNPIYAEKGDCGVMEEGR